MATCWPPVAGAFCLPCFCAEDLGIKKPPWADQFIRRSSNLGARGAQGLGEVDDGWPCGCFVEHSIHLASRTQHGILGLSRASG